MKFEEGAIFMLRNLVWFLSVGVSVLSGCGGSSTETSPGSNSVAKAPDTANAVAVSPPSTPSVASEEMVRILKAYKALPGAIDRTTFEVKARAAALGQDPQAAFAFVRDQVVTEPYPGVLRGAAGTLSAGAGNNLDKSLLLGALLAEGGHAVRYAHCELGTDQARNIVKAYFAESSAPTFHEADLTTALTSALELQGLPKERSAEIAAARDRTRDWLDTAVARTSDDDFKLVREKLTRAGIKQESVDTTQTLIDEARQHYWLQLKSGNDWQDFDPSNSGAVAGRSICRATETFDTLPANLYQSITLTVRNEYLNKGALTSAIALTKRIIVSEHYGDVLQFSNEVSEQSDLLKAPPKRMRPALTIGTAVTYGDEFEYDPAASGAAGFDPFGSALSGGEEEPPKLAAQWLDFAIEAPGRKSTVSRAIVDAVPPRERAEGRITTVPVPDLLLLSLIPTHAIAITAGRIQSGAAIESAYGSLDIDAAGRIYAGRDGSKKPSDDDVMEVATHMLGVYALQFGIASERALATSAAQAGAHLRVVRDQPMITIAGFSLHLNTKGELNLRASIDLRHDVIRVAHDGPGYSEQAFWENVRHGLVDGAIERHLPMAGNTAAPSSLSQTYDTSATVATAMAKGIDVRAVTGADAAALLKGDLADAGGERLLAEVGDGIAMVGPVQSLPAGGEPRFGIWTVDLRTGQVNALVDSGLRAVIVDYSLRAKAMAVLQVAIAVCLRAGARDCTGLISQWMRIAQEFIIQLSVHGV